MVNSDSVRLKSRPVFYAMSSWYRMVINAKEFQPDSVELCLIVHAVTALPKHVMKGGKMT